MKKITLFILCMMFGASSLVPSGYGKPEVMELKKTEQKEKQAMAEAQLKDVDLRNIEDPEARKAIREILNYLNLQSEK